MSALALSVLLSFVSAVAYAGGAIVQERVAVTSPGQAYAPLRRPAWWAALAMNGLGGLLHVAALAYGPLSLVQPLGALTIVFALPMAALFVGRKAGATAWRGAIMATVGLAGLLSLVGASEAHSLNAAQRVAVALVAGGAVAALMAAGRAAHHHPAVRSVLLATGSGIAFGMSSVFTKTVAVDWDEGIAAGELPALAVIAVFATAGVLLSQASYRGGGLAAPLATLTVVNPVVAAAVGITMFGETFRYGGTGTALALSCGVVAAGGLILLTTERIERTPYEVPEGTATAPRGEAGPASGRVASTASPEPEPGKPGAGAPGAGEPGAQRSGAGRTGAEARADGYGPYGRGRHGRGPDGLTGADGLTGLDDLSGPGGPADTPVAVPDAVPGALPDGPPSAPAPDGEPVRYSYGSLHGGVFVPVPAQPERRKPREPREPRRSREPRVRA
ncbi:DMT family transporter [Streptomyces sp. NPDC047000]|uniref:DMT family transporter n=1 Tax=Streptomyces sp. NPDC047000 TaxID=3155474 RepID=UPI0033DEC987